MHKKSTKKKQCTKKIRGKNSAQNSSAKKKQCTEKIPRKNIAQNLSTKKSAQNNSRKKKCKKIIH